jgi:hypothetical protein
MSALTPVAALKGGKIIFCKVDSPTSTVYSNLLQQRSNLQRAWQVKIVPSF